MSWLKCIAVAHNFQLKRDSETKQMWHKITFYLLKKFIFIFPFSHHLQLPISPDREPVQSFHQWRMLIVFFFLIHDLTALFSSSSLVKWIPLILLFHCTERSEKCSTPNQMFLINHRNRSTSVRFILKIPLPASDGQILLLAYSQYFIQQFHNHKQLLNNKSHDVHFFSC